MSSWTALSLFILMGTLRIGLSKDIIRFRDSKKVNDESLEIPLCRYEPSSSLNVTLRVTKRVCTQTTKVKCTTTKKRNCSPSPCEEIQVASDPLCRQVIEFSEICREHPCEESEQKCKTATFFSFKKLICYTRPKTGCVKCVNEPRESKVCDTPPPSLKKVCPPDVCSEEPVETCREVPVRECRNVPQTNQDAARLICDEVIRIPSSKLTFLDDEAGEIQKKATKQRIKST
eukprot:TRINITY_DN21827_c0_g1_i1.p1 TRINITY_DN21827_c0_g1~~TRINITY_DN21827_c0_g1_i1.p1  ORF type:complete len:231 (+),score=51.19 TRINITY_DN21827_c0_g1_i1:7-699(+)